MALSRKAARVLKLLHEAQEALGPAILYHSQAAQTAMEKIGKAIDELKRGGV